MNKKLRFNDFLKSILFLVFLGLGQLGFGQVTLVNFKFENNLTPEVGSIGSPLMTSSTAVSYFGGVTGQAASYPASTNKYFDLTLQTTGYENISISFSGRSSSSGSSWEVTGDSSGGTTFVPITTFSCPNGSFGALSSTLIGVNYGNKNLIKIRIKAIGTSATLRLDDLIIKGTASGCTPPTTQSTLAFSSVTSFQMGVALSGGNGAGRVVVMNTANVFTAPANGTNPTANATYGSGQQVVYNGTGSSFSVTGLNPLTTYYFRSYDYCDAERNYNATAITYNQATLASTNPVLSVSGSLSHGSVCSSTAATPITYTITNNGINAADGITIDSDNLTEFVISGLSSTSIPGDGGTATYVVTFTPSSAGAKSANLTITSTTSGSNSVNNALTGTGIAIVNQAVVTNTANSITINSASLRATSSTFGICPATTGKGFVYAETSLNSDPLFGGSNVVNVPVTLGSEGSFNGTVSSLSSGVNYTYKAYLYNGTTYTYGTAQNFTTLTPPLNDLCVNATVLTLNGVNLNGTLLSSTYTTPFTSKNDVWYSFTPTCTGSHVLTVSNFSGDVDVTVFSNANSCPSNTTSIASAASSSATETITSNFTAGVTYFVRVFAFNVAAESTFNINIVSPNPVTASVTTGLPSLVTQTSATLNASTSVFGVCPSTTIKGFVYAETLLNNDPLIGGSNVVNAPLALGVAGSFNEAVSSLSSDVNYTYKAYLYNGTTYTYGIAQNFTTLIPVPGAPLAIDATSIGNNQFTANWNAVSGATSYSIDVYKINAGVNASNLFISEYGEGSGGNKKYIEIFNGTGASVDLANYEIWLISNGGTWPNSTISLMGSLANNATYVVANNATDVLGANEYTGSLNFNGNDAVGLAWNGGSGATYNLIDAVGEDGSDPGSGWNVAGTNNATVDKILIRKASVSSPTTNWSTSAGTTAANSQWSVSSFTYNNTSNTTNLGSHVFDGGTTLEYVTGYNNLSVGNVLTHNVTGLESGTKYYYRVRASNTSGTSSNSNVIEVTTTGPVRWISTTATNWSTASNWSNNAVPDGTKDIEIPVGNPILNTNFTVQTGKSLTLSGTGTLTVAPTASLTVQGTADFGGKAVLLQSSTAGDAVIGEITGTLSNAANVTVERYIPARRAWKALTTPLKGSDTSLYSAWQNGGATIANTGVEIWGPAGTNMPIGPNYSVLNYTPTGWANVTNTATANLFDTTGNNAYLVFVTGAYGSGNISNGLSAATTLKATGELITGNVVHSAIINSKHTLIGNPYASPLDPSKVLNGGVNLAPSFWVWDPSLATTGGYVSYDVALGTYSNSTGSYSTNSIAIQSGQAFFVKANIATTGLLTLSEDIKSSAVSNVFGKNANQNLNNSTNASILRVGMFKESNQEWKPLDGAVAGFYDTASNLVDDSDGKKFANGGENIAFVRNNIPMSSEHFSTPQPLDEMYIRVWNTSVNNYKLRINTESFTVPNIEATLVDLFTGVQTPLVLDGSIQEYPFAVTSATASTGDRFKVVFSASPLATTVFDTEAIKVYPNPATNGIVNVQLPQGDYTNYSYELVNVLGQKVLSNTIEVLSGNQFSFNTKGLANNWYALRILNAGKAVYQTKVIIAN